MKKLDILLSFYEIANRAGFRLSSDNVIQIPPTNKAADALATAALTMVLGQTSKLNKTIPNSEDRIRICLTLLGPGPIWGWLAVVARLQELADEITVGLPSGTVSVYRRTVY